MKFFGKILLLLVLAGIYSPLAAAPADTLLVKDLSEDWLTFQEDYGLVPILDKKEFSGNVLHVPVALAQFKNNLIRITSDGTVSLFIDDKLCDMISGVRWYPVDSLIKEQGDSVILTFYQKKLNPYRLGTGIYRIVGEKMIEQMKGEQVIIAPRRLSNLPDVMILTLVIIAIYLAVIYAYYPRTTQEFFQTRRAFSLREMDENLMKSRPLSSVNLLFYILLSMMGAWILLGLVQLSGMHLRQQLFQFEEVMGGIWIWARLTLLLVLLIFLKYMLVRIFKSVFSIPGFLNNHYYNYVRIGLIIYVALMAWLLLSYFAFHIVSEGYYFNMLYVLAGLYLLRSVVIYFKLMNSSSYSILHLFSYLCATELVPIMLIIAFVKYQPV